MRLSLNSLVPSAFALSLSACGLVTARPDFPSAEVSNQICYDLNGAEAAQRPRQFAANFAIARYQASGAIDRRFGDNGTATADLGETHEAVSALVPQEDGIVAAGYASQEAIALARFQSDGSLDPSFGSNGTVLTPLYPANNPPKTWGDRLNEQVNIITTSDGLLVIAERQQPGTSDQPGFGRQAVVILGYTRDGQLNRNFGPAGQVITELDGKASIYDIAQQPDGRLVAVGRLDPGLEPSPDTLLVLRYLPDGTLDASFGKAGVVTLDLHHEDVALAVEVTPDGHLWVGGYWRPRFGLNFPLQSEPPVWLLAQLDAEGNLVTDFGENGYLRGDRFARETLIRSINARADGSLLLASPKALLAQYEPGANQFTPFAPPENRTAAGYMYPKEMVVEADGVTALGGGDYGTVNDCPHLARYGLDGSLDESFGDNGIVPLTPDLNQSHAIATQGGTIWVGGNTVQQ